VRLPGAIGGGKGCLVTVSVWRSFEHKLIGLMITRKGERGSPERRGKHGGASLIRSGKGRGVGRSWCGEDGARAVPFIGARERERDGGDGERRRARHDGENGANGDWDGSGRRGVRGRLGHSGGVVAEVGARLNGEATEREGLGGERADEAWARTMELTGGPELLAEARARVAGPPGPGRGGGGGRSAGARSGLGRIRPSRGGGEFLFFFFYFFSFPFLLFVSFYFFFLGIKNFLHGLE
jgi:hypothetical protein